VYYYNTSPLFAEEPACKSLPRPEGSKLTQSTDAFAAPPSEPHAPELVRTLESITEEKKSRLVAAETVVPTTEPTSPEELEEEAESQGAFNPETGEINWDCPCLGGMAHGPCGEEFKAAFSCFVYSTEEPKGMDCIDKFKGMQDCFRKFPEVYGAELEDIEEGEGAGAAEAGTPQQNDAIQLQNEKRPEKPQPTDTAVDQAIADEIERARAARDQVESDFEPLSESDEAIPRAWHDTSVDNVEKKISEKK